jgi:ribulose-phosphate 3-epimerase
VRKRGIGGQTSNPEMDQKVRRIREKTNLPKGEDGAIAAKMALLVVGARAQGLVAGSAIYTGDPVPEMCKITEAGRHTARR